MKKIKLPKIKLPKIYLFGIDIVKNMLFFTLFIFITILSIGVIIAPSVKNFKKNQKEYFKVLNEYNKEKNKLNTLNSELLKLKNENIKIINAFKREFNVKNFKNFASKYLSINEINETNKSVYKKEFIKTTFLTSAKIKSPKNFYDLIDALKNYKYVIRVYFPINFQKEKENISLLFKIEHYKLKDKHNTPN
jgi:hypothetical protein